MDVVEHGKDSDGVLERLKLVKDLFHLPLSQTKKHSRSVLCQRQVFFLVIPSLGCCII